jgi:hypothetical protein
VSATDWQVHPHGELQPLSDNLWRVQGSLPGMPLERVMIVARMRDGRLVVHGAMALDEATMKRLEALGEPAVMLVPSGYHRMDAPRYAQRYPGMKIYCPKGSLERVHAVVRVDGTFDDFEGDATVRTTHLDGVADIEGVVHVTSGDGSTLVFNDALFNMPHAPGLGGLFTRLIGSSGGLRVSNTGRFFLVKDARMLGARLVALAGTPGLVRIAVAHHETFTDHPAEALRAVAGTL